MKIVCRNCGTEFKSYSSHRKFCSPKCFREYERKLHDPKDYRVIPTNFPMEEFLEDLKKFNAKYGSNLTPKDVLGKE